MAMEHVPFETAEGQDAPTVRQVSVFLDNRIGELMRLTKLFESDDVRILALSVVDSADCAIIRLVFDSTDEALAVLRQSGFAVSVAELVVVKLPPGKRGLLSVWSALLGGEVNIGYAYALLGAEVGSAIALYVDNAEIAVDTLKQRGFEVLDERNLAG